MGQPGTEGALRAWVNPAGAPETGNPKIFNNNLFSLFPIFFLFQEMYNVSIYEV